MSERGSFSVDRGVFDHPLFDGEVYSKRDAWLWLIREASWKPRRTRVGTAFVELQRGQCCHTIRFMAEKWGWHRAKVERFLGRLKTETMIETSSETGATVITICKYNDYQAATRPNETSAETGPETVARQLRDKAEEGNNKKDLLSSIDDAPPSKAMTKASPKAKPASANVSARTTRGGYSDEYERAFKAWPSRGTGDRKKKDGAVVFERIIASGVDPEQLIRAIAARAAELRAEGVADTRHTPMLVSWLRSDEWRERLAPAPAPRQATAAGGEDWPEDLPPEATVKRYYERGEGGWPVSLGPAPGYSGCRVPAAVLDRWSREVEPAAGSGRH